MYLEIATQEAADRCILIHAMRTILSLCTLAACALSMGQSCCNSGKPMSADEKFMKEAHAMMMKAEGKTACCQSTAAKPMAKGTMSCCKAKSAKVVKGVKIAPPAKAKRA